jgi:hypothetical protein
MNFGLFESLPIAGVYVGVGLVMLVFCEVGYQVGKRVRTRQDKEALTSLGPMVGGVLGLLAFVLAFTFSMAASQHDHRRQIVLAEATAVGTAYLRSDLIEMQYEKEVKSLLREYVDIRLQAASGGDLDAALARSVDIHMLLWAQVSSAAAEAPSANTSLMIQSINDVIDMHEKRVAAALRNRIPISIWVALFAISVLTMITLGTQSGLTGKRGLFAVIPLVLAFAAIIVLVVDLDRPRKGPITVGQQAMVNLQSSMGRETK